MHTLRPHVKLKDCASVHVCVHVCVCAPLLSVSVKTAKALFWRRVKAGYHHGSRGYVYKEVSVSSKNIQQRGCVCVCVCVCVCLWTLNLTLPPSYFPGIIYQSFSLCVCLRPSFSSDRHSLLHTCHRTRQNITAQTQTLFKVWTHSGHTRTHVSTQFQIRTHSQMRLTESKPRFIFEFLDVLQRI